MNWREARRAYQRQWREKHREELREYYRKWRKANKGKVAEYTRRYWIKKAEEAGKKEKEAIQ